MSKNVQQQTLISEEWESREKEMMMVIILNAARDARRCGMRNYFCRQDTSDFRRRYRVPVWPERHETFIFRLFLSWICFFFLGIIDNENELVQFAILRIRGCSQARFLFGCQTSSEHRKKKRSENWRNCIIISLFMIVVFHKWAVIWLWLWLRSRDDDDKVPATMSTPPRRSRQKYYSFYAGWWRRREEKEWKNTECSKQLHTVRYDEADVSTEHTHWKNNDELHRLQIRVCKLLPIDSAIIILLLHVSLACCFFLFFEKNLNVQSAVSTSNRQMRNIRIHNNNRRVSIAHF